ncbi:plastid delta12-fatty acid acetylenase [Artemisia annua]|uniref:Plastid delta12-fatty acid acetylenase n=1 Tax=Artemisia annua TaxID=35608 RepID=A0A2U1L7T4_ARTAN|nr:plastid delta12-fatty acid acetylenase [Artemisia annua]
MGAGGRMSDSPDQAKDGILKRVPIDPPFSLSDLKKASLLIALSVLSFVHLIMLFMISSEYQLVDDIVGFVLHSALFTPYFSWKYSHRSHHANTNSLDNDEVYIPKRFPLYLLTNVSGKKYERFANHVDPLSPIFTEREQIQVMLSDLGIIAVVYALKLLVAAKGFTWVMCMYGIPVIGVHTFFV